MYSNFVRDKPRLLNLQPTTGSGIGFSPNGQYVLWSLGLKKEVDSIMQPIKRMVYRNRKGEVYS